MIVSLFSPEKKLSSLEDYPEILKTLPKKFCRDQKPLAVSNEPNVYFCPQRKFTVAKKMTACRFYQNALRVSSKNSWEKMIRSKANGLKF